jgi:hypothetical protein
MDPKVDSGRYTKLVDIYSLALVFIFILKGQGIYSECLSMFDLKKKRNSIYRDYEDKIEA